MVEETRGGMKKKILLADDDPDTLFLLSKILVNQGYEVQCLTNASGIVNESIGQWPDLFILDKEMTLIDGIAICKYLRLHKIARHIPIIMISGCDCRTRATSAGADFYIDKPFDVRELLEVVERFISTPIPS